MVSNNGDTGTDTGTRKQQFKLWRGAMAGGHVVLQWNHGQPVSSYSPR